MTDNLMLWEKLGKTDPAQTKKFKRAGGFEGTAIKPMWSYKRMTEEFGPCGKGWGVGEPAFQVVPGENREVLVYCTASIWYREGEKNAVVYGVGGDKVVTYIKANEQYKRPERWESDDEAFKKAFTDAVTNALKLIGVGADVHMGMFDDNKYVNTMAKEFSEAAKPEKVEPARAPDGYAAMVADLKKCQQPDDVTRWWNDEQVVEYCAKVPVEWASSLKDEVIAYRKHLKSKDTVSAIKDQFPGGASVVNETHQKEAAE